MTIFFLFQLLSDYATAVVETKNYPISFIQPLSEVSDYDSPWIEKTQQSPFLVFLNFNLHCSEDGQNGTFHIDQDRTYQVFGTAPLSRKSKFTNSNGKILANYTANSYCGFSLSSQTDGRFIINFTKFDCSKAMASGCSIRFHPNWNEGDYDNVDSGPNVMPLGMLTTREEICRKVDVAEDKTKLNIIEIKAKSVFIRSSCPWSSILNISFTITFQSNMDEGNSVSFFPIFCGGILFLFFGCICKDKNISCHFCHVCGKCWKRFKTKMARCCACFRRPVDAYDQPASTPTLATVHQPGACISPTDHTIPLDLSDTPPLYSTLKHSKKNKNQSKKKKAASMQNTITRQQQQQRSFENPPTYSEVISELGYTDHISTIANPSNSI